MPQKGTSRCKVNSWLLKSYKNKKQKIIRR